MAGALRKTMLYLGLADDGAANGEYPDEFEGADVPMEHEEHEAQVTPFRPTRVAAVEQPQPVSELRRITTIHPRSYNDAPAAWCHPSRQARPRVASRSCHPRLP